MVLLQGCYVICADWKDNEFMAVEEFCDEFHKVDLRLLENCLKVTRGCQHVYNLAADMGGMGFIVSNQAVLLYNNTQLSFNMLEVPEPCPILCPSPGTKLINYLCAS